jgi:hypothetical protein
MKASHWITRLIPADVYRYSRFISPMVIALRPTITNCYIPLHLGRAIPIWDSAIQPFWIGVAGQPKAGGFVMRKMRTRTLVPKRQHFVQRHRKTIELAAAFAAVITALFKIGRAIADVIHSL